MSEHIQYIVKLVVPGVPEIPVPPFIVAAGSEDSAVDVAFDKAFRAYGQYGSFRVEWVKAA